MILVIHYDTNKDPDIYYGIDHKTENKILKDMKTGWYLTKSSAENWPGNDRPGYGVRHWDATKKRSK